MVAARSSGQGPQPVPGRFLSEPVAGERHLRMVGGARPGPRSSAETRSALRVSGDCCGSSFATARWVPSETLASPRERSPLEQRHWDKPYTRHRCDNPEEMTARI
jgi:hypothetical protein